MGQLSLFGGGGDDDGSSPARTTLAPVVRDDDAALSRQLPNFVRFGTSSWSFPGWTGIVWQAAATPRARGSAPTEAELARTGLEAYAKHPLFRAVGLDRGHYAPLRAEELTTYAAQLARAEEHRADGPKFRVLTKVWEEITTAVFPAHRRYGARAGTKNPHFLDADRFRSEVLAPYVDSDFLRWCGPFLFELTPMPRGTLDERTLSARVDHFLGELPSSLAASWAFELRNAELFGRRWVDMLRANGATHVFNYWTAMPELREQLRVARAAGLPERRVVVRLMIPPFTRYAERKASLAPFDKLTEPQPAMRDDVLEILRAAEEAGCEEGFVLVNNKAEGSAPLTIRALSQRAVEVLRPRDPSR